MKYVVVDLDGTLCDTAHRVHFLQQQPKDWDGWNGACVDDPCVDAIRDTITGLRSAFGHRIVFLSGRSDEVREQTEAWLEHHVGFPFTSVSLRMRKAGDHRDDAIVKLELAADAGITPDNTLIVFEDRSRVVKAWREAGFFCAQVADGDF